MRIFAALGIIRLKDAQKMRYPLKGKPATPGEASPAE
jgi:hypothetical protein